MWLVYPWALWFVLYVIVQPLVNAVIFEKLLLGGGGVKALVIAAVILWTYIETGEIVSRNSAAGFLTLAYFVSVAVPVVFYLFTRKISIAYVGDALFRMSTAVMMIFALGASVS